MGRIRDFLNARLRRGQKKKPGKTRERPTQTQFGRRRGPTWAMNRIKMEMTGRQFKALRDNEAAKKEIAERYGDLNGLQAELKKMGVSGSLSESLSAVA